MHVYIYIYCRKPSVHSCCILEVISRQEPEMSRSSIGAYAFPRDVFRLFLYIVSDVLELRMPDHI